MRKSNLRTTAAWQALALLGAGLPAAFMTAAPAHAQDYTRGGIQGTVNDEQGNPVAGATVTLRSNEQGFSQTTTSNANGQFQFNLLPTGSYTLIVTNPAGTEIVRDQNAVVTAGGTASFIYTAGGAPGSTATGTGDGAIVVTGRRVQTNDFAATTTGLTLDVAQVAQSVPVPRTQTGLILLAPGTSLGDQNFADCADCVSFGGATIAENSYYVNGLNTTNFRTLVGNSLVPFEFYRTFDVKTGGWTAEYGRALGGVTSAVTKSGSNRFEYGAVVTYSPDILNSDAPNTFRDANGRLKQFNEADYREQIQGNFYVSGAPIRDRVFFYGLYAPRYNVSKDTSVIGGFRFNSKSTTPFYGAKVDVIPIDGHRLEGTFWSDRRHIFTDYYPVNDQGTVTRASIGREDNEIGGKNWIAQYTGQFTKWFTLSGLYGVNNYKRRDVVLGSSATPIIQTQIGGPIRTAGSVSGIPLVPTNGDDKRTVYRVDADLYVNFLGRHHFRAGWDREDLESEESTFYTGGRIYLFRPAYIRTRTYINEGGFTSKQTAFYLQDSWDLLNERLNLQLGIRNDNYENANVEGRTFIEMKNQWAPRVGASFDVFGDKLTKVQAFWGRYYLGVPTNTNIRLGGAEVFYEQRFNYAPGVSGSVFDPATGIPIGQQYDPTTGAPILGTLTGANAAPCPTFGPGSGQLCYGVFSDGIAGPTDTLVAENLKPMYQDEIILGATHRMDDWTFGARYINRRLKQTLEDVSIDHAVQAYCTQEGIADCQYYWYGFHQYVLSNPGEPITVRLDGGPLCATDPRACEVVTLSPELLRYEKPTRKYDAVELLVGKAFNGTYGFDFSYTWQKVRGNYEGSVKSDNNQDDAGLTQDFDLPGFQEGATGILANERKHTFKFYGSWKPVDWVRVGGNITVQSPRNFSCIGMYPIPYAFPDTTGGPSLYGPATFWSANPLCADKAVQTMTGAGGRTYYLVPRGTAFKGEWLKNVDLGVQFQLPGVLSNSSVRVDVFNLFDWKSKIDFVEFGDEGDRSARVDYGFVTGYQAPRAVRLTWAMRFGGDGQ